MRPRSGAYVPGHAPREIDRLVRQARMVEPITRRFLIEAGVQPGMRVLDVGSGVGDVAFLAASLVGSSGHVTGIDRSSTALGIARARADALSLANVRFDEADVADAPGGQTFDAVVGRYVLMYQPDAAAALRGLTRRLQPGGVVCFHEPSWASARSFPPVPSWDRCCAWVVSASTREIDFEMGSKLHAAFVGAGLAPPTLRSEAIIGAGANGFEQVRFTTDVVVALLPHLETLGVIAPGAVDPDRLAEAVAADVAASESVVVGRTEIGAWSRA